MSTRKTAENEAPKARWPALMAAATAAEYLSMSADTFNRICRVQPVDLPFSGVRWRRKDLDAWIEGLPTRERKTRKAPERTPLDIPPPKQTPEERRARALSKVAGRGC